MARPKKVVQKTTDKPERQHRPAVTPEGRESQLISLAVDLAEQQLRDGTASAQVITHFLKLGSTREQVELEKMKRENTLLKAKTDAIQSAQRTEELYAAALEAMRSYGTSNKVADDADVNTTEL